MINIRQEAALALEEILCRGGYSSLTVNEYLKKIAGQTEERDRRFFTNLVYTTLDHLPSIDAVIAAHSKTPLKKIKPYLLVCLRMGICQLKYMESVPDRAAINETVELVKKSKLRALAGFVNGVLRGAQRNGCAYPLPDMEREPVKALGLRYDMPEWIVTLWLKDYGKEQTEMLLQKMQQSGSVCLRANTLKATADEIGKRIAESLGEEGSVRQSSAVPEAFYAEHIGDISKWELYQEGYIAVQDESSMLAALATGAKPGDQVLDLCAAPGGKSAFMAQMMQNTGLISSRDLHEHRVKLIQQNAQRLGISCIQTVTADATQPQPEDFERYDVVLLDAPCSGLGIMRSKPDIKLHHSLQDVEDLVKLQRQILPVAAEAVKPGGTLVYSTCTLNKKENDEQVEWFLEKYPNFVLKDLENRLPSLPECDRLWKKHLTLWPQAGGHDGFFVACLEKQA